MIYGRNVYFKRWEENHRHIEYEKAEPFLASCSSHRCFQPIDRYPEGFVE
jgi:hypothetical protein